MAKMAMKDGLLLMADALLSRSTHFFSQLIITVNCNLVNVSSYFEISLRQNAFTKSSIVHACDV